MGGPKICACAYSMTQRKRSDSGTISSQSKKLKMAVSAVDDDGYVPCTYVYYIVLLDDLTISKERCHHVTVYIYIYNIERERDYNVSYGGIYLPIVMKTIYISN